MSRLRTWLLAVSVLVGPALAEGPARDEVEAHRHRARVEQVRAQLEEAGPLPGDLGDEVRQILDQVADYDLPEVRRVYAEVASPALQLEVDLQAGLRREWLGRVEALAGAGRVGRVEEYPVVGLEVPRRFLELVGRGPADPEVEATRLDTLLLLEWSGFFEATLGETFCGGLGDVARDFVRRLERGELGDAEEPPERLGVQLSARAAVVAQRLGEVEAGPATLGEALARWGDRLAPTPLGLAASMLQEVRLLRDWTRIEREEQAVRELHYPTLGRLERLPGLPDGLADRLRGLMQVLHERLDDDGIESLHEVFHDPHEGAAVRAEGDRMLDLWMEWRRNLATWSQTPGEAAVASLPLPPWALARDLLDAMRAPLPAPLEESGRKLHQTVTRLDMLEFMDDAGGFEAAMGRRFFDEELDPELERCRRGTGDESRDAAAFLALGELVRARLAASRVAPTWREPGTLGEAMELRRGRLRPMFPGEDASLLRVALGELEPAAPGPVPPGEGSPADRDPRADPVDAEAATDAATDAQVDFLLEAFVYLLALVLVCGTVVVCFWSWRRGKAHEAEAERARSAPPPVDPAPTPRPPTPTPAGDVTRTPAPSGGAAGDTMVSGRPPSAAAPTAVPAATAVPRRVEGDLPTWLAAALFEALGERYVRYSQLGAGGMGTVVKAFDSRLERWVAIKVPPPHLASHEQFQARFLREARALAKLGHPNIGGVIDVPDVAPGGIPVMVLEFLDGIDLGAYLDQRGRPAPKLALQWIVQAGRGLHFAHTQGVLHRDIKPSNLMLVQERERASIKILDFGLAALEDRQALTRSGMLMGSLPYMPPEQFQGSKVDQTADLYALAVSAYELLAGKLPFQPEDAQRRVVPRISQAGTGIPASLDPVLLQAMDPEPGRRHASVQEFLDAIQALARPARSGPG